LIGFPQGINGMLILCIDLLTEVESDIDIRISDALSSFVQRCHWLMSQQKATSCTCHHASHNTSLL
jgi:hypothetical protein